MSNHRKHLMSELERLLYQSKMHILNEAKSGNMNAVIQCQRDHVIIDTAIHRLRMAE